MSNVTITVNSGGGKGNQMGQGYYQPGMQQPNPFVQPQPQQMQMQQMQPMNPYVQPQPMVQQQPVMMQQPVVMQQPVMMQPTVVQQPVIVQPNVNQQLLQQNMALQNQLLKNQMNQKVPLSGWDRLQMRDGIFVKQKFDWEETITGCEQPNTYYVYGLSKDGEAKGNMLFKCQEKSSCCARTCLSGECRPFQVCVKTVDKEFEQLDNEPFLKIDRPCKCTCYCFSRPEITVTCVLNGGDEFVGKVIDPCQCGNIVLNIYNNRHSLAYIVEGSCCQLGIWCKFPCEPCQNIDFKVKGADGVELSELKKKSPGCHISQMSSADNFTLTFPPGCTKEDKAVLLATVLFLDFRHFEENSGKKQDGKNQIIVVGGED